MRRSPPARAPRGPPPPPARRFDSLLAAFEEEIAISARIGERLRPTQYVYQLRARALRAGSADERAAALARLQTVLDEALRRQDLPMVDALEFQYVRDRLEEEGVAE